MRASAAPFPPGSHAFPGAAPAAPRGSHLDEYAAMVAAYHQTNLDYRAAIDSVCGALVSESKIPEIVDAGGWEESAKGAGDGAGADEDERALHMSVKRRFVAAMEELQSAAVPKKRRGNLPKEATDRFREWFERHYEHPYPTDEEKRTLAAETGTAVAQITNWFINHRKRVWKPAGGGVAERNGLREAAVVGGRRSEVGGGSGGAVGAADRRATR